MKLPKTITGLFGAPSIIVGIILTTSLPFGADCAEEGTPPLPSAPALLLPAEKTEQDNWLFRLQEQPMSDMDISYLRSLNYTITKEGLVLPPEGEGGDKGRPLTRREVRELLRTSPARRKERALHQQQTLSGISFLEHLKGEFKQFVSMTGRFACEIPTDWTVSKKTASSNSILLSLMSSPSEQPATLQVRYYIRKEFDRQTQSGFMALSPLLRVRSGEVMEVTRTFSEPVPAKSRVSERPAQKTPFQIRERHAIIAANDGCFVLTYRASPHLYHRHLPTYERMLSTFSPLQ